MPSDTEVAIPFRMRLHEKVDFQYVKTFRLVHFDRFII